MIDLIGFDHIFITVTDLARAETFHDRVMPIFGFRKGCFTIGDGVRQEVTNYRQERRERHDRCERLSGAAAGMPVPQVG